MPVYKLVPVLLIVGLIVSTGLFYFNEDLRPPFVERLFLAAQGLGPAKTPNECLDKFKMAIRKRNYKAAATFCGGEYAEELTRASKMARRLGDAVEELLHNVKVVAAINEPQAELAVRRLYPFPGDFKVNDLKHKDGADQASAYLILDDGKALDAKDEDVLNSLKKYRIDERIIFAATPCPWLLEVDARGVPLGVPLTLKLMGDKEKSWKIFFPDSSVSGIMRERMQYLRDYGGNYVRALENVKYEIKHDAATKSGFAEELRKQLAEAK